MVFCARGIELVTPLIIPQSSSSSRSEEFYEFADLPNGQKIQTGNLTARFQEF